MNGLAQDLAVAATSDLFARVLEVPAVQALARRLEQGGVLSCSGISPTAQPFFAALLRSLLPRRPILIVTEGLKTQELVHQDISTWLQFEPRSRRGKEADSPMPSSASSPRQLRADALFYPAWEILPHDSRLPHADVISERLE